MKAIVFHFTLPIVYITFYYFLCTFIIIFFVLPAENENERFQQSIVKKLQGN
jgi:hypothetical protein